MTSWPSFGRATQPPGIQRFIFLSLSLVSGAGCATGGVPVSPGEIPTLEQRLREDPNDADAAIRYAAALFAGGNCEGAIEPADRAQSLRPASAIPPLIVGRCSERNNDFDEARRVYARYLAGSPTREGAEAVVAQDEIAARSQARQRALDALEREAQLGEPDPQAMAVLSWDMGENPGLRPLSIGLARLVSSDLIQLQRFQLLERIQLTALLDELELGQTDVVAKETAPRVGRLIGAGQLLQGSLIGSPTTPIALAADVTRSTGEVITSATRSSDYEDILVLQKELVLQMARDLGYELTEAERQTILENGTRSLTAFLAFANGLAAEALGDYGAAEAYFSEAVASDPEFDEARSRKRTTAAIVVTQGSSPGEITTIEGEAYDAASVGEGGGSISNPLGGAVTSSIGDVAATQGESAGQGSGSSDSIKQINQLTKPITQPDLLRAVIRIMIQIPGGE